MEHTILSAQDRIVALEYQLFCDIRDQVAAQAPQIQEIAGAVARVDVLTSFAVVAAENNYCMPRVDNSDKLEITGKAATRWWRSWGGRPLCPQRHLHGQQGQPGRHHHWPQHGRQVHLYAAGGPHGAHGPRWGPLSLPGRPTSGWWTGFSPALGPRTTWRGDSPPLWWR